MMPPQSVVSHQRLGTLIVGTRTGYNTYSYECSVSDNLEVREPRTEVPRPLN